MSEQFNETRKQATGLLARFWGFEELLGNALIKFVYYVGLVLIALATIVMTFGPLIGSANGGSMGFGLLMLIGGPLLGLLYLIFWRFFCEMALLAFLTYDRLGDIRDKLP